MVSDHGMVFLEEGLPCPTDDPLFECSGRGSCDCTSGKCLCDLSNKCLNSGYDCAPKCSKHASCDPTVGDCVCDSCWLPGPNADCGEPLMCTVNAHCDVAHNDCVCDPCYTHDAIGFCTTFNTCNGHGACAAALVNGTAKGVCACTGGWSGVDCGIAPPSPDNKGKDDAIDGTVGVLVGLPVTLIAIAGAYLAWFRYTNPLKPLHAAIPVQLQKRLGFAVYESSIGNRFMAPGRGSTSAAAAASSTSASSSGGGGGKGFLSSLGLSFGGAGAGFSKGLPSIIKGNAEEAMARSKLLAASSSSAASGRAGASSSSSSGSRFSGGGYGGLGSSGTGAGGGGGLYASGGVYSSS